MSSLSEIRNNLHNKIKHINKDDLFYTPYKPFVQIYVDNREEQDTHSYRE